MRRKVPFNQGLHESQCHTYCITGSLTYMSIREEWLKHVRNGLLFEVKPLDGDSSPRTVLMSEEVRDLVEGNWEGEKGKRCAKLLATLQNIVVGAHLVVNMDPYTAREARIGRLHPVEDGVWDIRAREKPGLRVFCAFLERDVMVAFICSPRSVNVSWLSRLPLGVGDSIEWENAIKETKREWAKLFPAHARVTGDDLNEYLSNASHEGD
jgi:putative component of toxin-antitoxin plasmid stabilization module